MTAERLAVPGVRAIDHVAIVVQDIDSALAYYVETLGLDVVEDEVLDERSARLAYVDAGNVLIQLVQPLGDGPVATFLAERGEGLHHICFAVDRIEQTLEALDAETNDGIFKGGRGRRACFLKDRMNGTLVELYDQHDGQAS